MRSAEEVAELHRAHAWRPGPAAGNGGRGEAPRATAGNGDRGAPRATAGNGGGEAPPATPEEAWARDVVAQIERFAAEHERPQPLVRVTLADGERFFLAALEARPGAGFVTLHPHPERVADARGGADGASAPPRSLIVPLSAVQKIELLEHVPRGTRSGVGFLL